MEVDKESSGVQTSASLLRRKRGRRKAGYGSGVGAGAVSSSSPAVSSGVDEEVSRPHVLPEGGGGEQGSGGPAGSRPLASFVEMVRSHEYGSLFNRRLPIEETGRYRSLIRQHIDLDSIHSRLDDSAYSRTELFRDLLLLCANATVFFARGSDEHAAGVALRAIIMKELAKGLEECSNRSSSSGPETTKQEPIVMMPKDEEARGAALVDIPSLLEKPVSSLVACRKRNAVLSDEVGGMMAERRQKQPEVGVKEEEEKPEKENDRPLLDGGRVVGKPFNRGLRTTKAHGLGGRKTHPIADVKDESPEPPVAKAELANSVEPEASIGSSPSTPAITAVVAKKRSAAGFLKRLKGKARSPSPSMTDESPSKVAATVKAPAAAAASPSSAKPPQEPAIQSKKKGRPPKRKVALPSPLQTKRVRAGPDPVTASLGRLRGGNRKRG